MGTSLTGTKPKDTYDSLIKVGDNGPIGATAKVLSDGLGNDLPIAVSTSNVGIGTSSPNTNLEVRQDVESGGPVLSISNYFDSAVLTQTNAINFNFLRTDTNTNQVAARIEVGKQDTYSGSAERASYISFQTQLGGGVTERMRITAAGVVELAQGQIKFPATQVASADPNTLDDYEEGTWTPTTSTSGYTISASSGTYTKIGRQVVLQYSVTFSAVDGSSNSVAVIGSVPFAASATFVGQGRDTTTSGAAYAAVISTSNLTISSIDGVATGSSRIFATSEAYVFTLTYFV